MQPFCLRTARTGAGQVSPAASSASRIEFETSAQLAACTLPITVHDSSVSRAAGSVAVRRRVGRRRSRAVASTMLSIAAAVDACSSSRSAPTIERSSSTLDAGDVELQCRLGRLLRGTPSGSSVQAGHQRACARARRGAARCRRRGHAERCAGDQEAVERERRCPRRPIRSSGRRQDQQSAGGRWRRGARRPRRRPPRSSSVSVVAPAVGDLDDAGAGRRAVERGLDASAWSSGTRATAAPAAGSGSVSPRSYSPPPRSAAERRSGTSRDVGRVGVGVAIGRHGERPELRVDGERPAGGDVRPGRAVVGQVADVDLVALDRRAADEQLQLGVGLSIGSPAAGRLP